ncbi:hypothetical protein C0214_02915 [Methylobacterium sp. DM1]|nr:hypothetical protein C0214_02915 [Methylobacterium sp. DM1]
MVIGLEKFWVKFQPYRDFEEKIYSRHTGNLMDEHWRKEFMWHEVGEPLQKAMSSYSHQDGPNITRAISALYSDRDCKILTHYRVAVRAYWTGHSLDAIEFYNGDDKQLQKVKAAERRSAHSPSYKET